jgi:hypothetical protein
MLYCIKKRKKIYKLRKVDVLAASPTYKYGATEHKTITSKSLFHLTLSLITFGCVADGERGPRPPAPRNSCEYSESPGLWTLPIVLNPK